MIVLGSRLRVRWRALLLVVRALADACTRVLWYLGEGTTMMTPVLDDGTLRWRC